MSIRDLEPESVWSRFFFVCGIPHPSHHEKALALALAERARARGFFAIEGEGGNLVIRKPASPGREGSAGIILQAHLDMVPQSAAGSSHNFLRDPIRPRIDPQDPAWLIADGTTLGADNGIGLAMALSVLEEPGLPHGPLECLFTVNEEDGMTGARRVEPGILKGSILLNLDGEDDAELTIGCAGSIRTSCRFSIPAERAPGGLEWFDVSVEGLAGGHSGIDIGKGRANAALVLARLLSRTGSGFLIASIEAGSAANAIPRSAAARIGLAPGGTKAFRAVFRREAALLRAELGTGDPGLKTAFKPPPGPPPKYALGAGDGARMLALLASLPNGSRATEPGLPDSIRTSSNLGCLSGRPEEGRFLLSTLVMVRSSSEEDKESLAREIESKLLGAAGRGWSAETSRPSESPPWPPDNSSPLLAAAKAVYRDLYGKDPRIVCTHGGLETGIFRSRFPEWEMICLGPKLLYPHSPYERLEIASVGRSYRFLQVVLRTM